MKIESWKLATLFAVGVAADSYLDAYAQSQSGGNLPPPGVVYAEPNLQPQPVQPVVHNYLPPPQSSQQPWYMPYSLKPFDTNAIIPIGLATIFKVLLKLFIFKMIVKFFATLCILMFLPKLMEEEKMMMSSTTTKPEEPALPPPEEEAREQIVKAVTTEPPICAENDWPCYLLQSLKRRLSTRTHRQKRQQQSSMKRSYRENNSKKNKTL
ncbi:uncharacterized protein LOC142324426 [Lycorma delicatula]|uniref:uncharacterized protein LOC142324426 n=1 Tax=Lycorma delicatula TaxID=130591 RepID=UPI003F5163B3